MTTALTPIPTLQPLAALACQAVASPQTRRAYASALARFLGWCEAGGHPLTRQTVQEYRVGLETAKKSRSSINQSLSAIKKLASEAAASGLMDYAVAQSIESIPGLKRLGVRAGNWLTRRDAERLLELPDAGTMKGKRDRALLALLLGCGLRRAEAAELTIDRLQLREGRWCLVDISGKGGRVGTVPVPDWGERAIREWVDRAGIVSGRILRMVNKGGRIEGQSITPDAIWHIVVGYAKRLGVEVRPHDLRRSFGRLARKGGAPLDQIQQTYRHSDSATTGRYLGAHQDLETAPCDVLGLEPW